MTVGSSKYTCVTVSMISVAISPVGMFYRGRDSVQRTTWKLRLVLSMKSSRHLLVTRGHNSLRISQLHSVNPFTVEGLVVDTEEHVRIYCIY